MHQEAEEQIGLHVVPKHRSLAVDQIGCLQGHTVVQHSHQGSDTETAGRFVEVGPNTTVF